MKYRFLLDLNLVYHAVRGVDKYDNPDTSCAELLLLIGQNCHKVVFNEYLVGEYLKRLDELFQARAAALQPIDFVKQLLSKAEKFIQEAGDLPPILTEVQIPQEGVEIVKSALVSRPIIVTADEGLCAALNNSDNLGLQAKTPEAALILAREV